MAVDQMSTAKLQNVAYFLILVGILDTTAACVVIMQLYIRILAIGASPILAGLIMALYGGVQFFSSSFVGRLGDKMDKKKLLLICLVVSGANYYLLGYNSLVITCIARILLGGFKHTHLLAQSYLTDIVPASKKGDYFGYFGGGIGLGFIIGPTISGHLASWEDGFPAMAKFTAALFFVNAVLVWVFLPSSTKNVAASKSSSPTNNKLKTKKDGSVGVGQLWDILLLELFSELSVLVFFTNFMNIMANEYSLPPKSLGYTLSVLSIIGMLMAMVSGKLNRFAGKLVLPVSMTVMFGALLCVSLLPPYWMLIVALFFAFGSLSLLRSIWPSNLTSRCSPDMTASAVGMSNSVMAVSSMLGPITAGVATEVCGNDNGAAVLSAALASLGALATIWLPKSQVNPKVKSS